MPVEVIEARLKERGFELAGPYSGGVSIPTPLRCSEGHVWVACAADVFRGNGCPHCSGKAKLTVEEIERRLSARGIELAGPYSGTTQKPTPLRCSEGHEWKAALSSVLNKGTGCPLCARWKAPLTIEEINARLAERGFELAGMYVGNVSAPTPLRCAEGHQWDARLDNVLHKGTGCPHCAGKAPITVEVIERRLTSRGIELAGPYVGTTQKPTPLRCQTCDHQWKTRLSSIFKGSGCPHCSSATLATEEIERRLAARGIEIVMPYIGSTKKPTPLRCQTCDHQWKTRLHHVFSGKGCPACARDPWLTQSIYHLHHPDVPPQYVGISTKPKVRLEEHQQDDGPRGELARSIDEPELLSNADIFTLYEAAYAEERLPETVQNWFESNPHGKLPPGRLWFTDWFDMDAKESRQPAKVPRFVAEWVETEMIRALSENFPTPDNPFLQAGKVSLVNVAKNTPLRPVA